MSEWQRERQRDVYRELNPRAATEGMLEAWSRLGPWKGRRGDPDPELWSRPGAELGSRARALRRSR